MRIQTGLKALLDIEVLQQSRLPFWQEQLWENKNEIIYGPIASRRLGESLGINLFPRSKICSFNCRYCDVGLTTSRAMQVKIDRSNILSPDLVNAEIESKIRNLLAKGVHIDHITMCGNGEATDYPYFVKIAEFLLSLKNRLFPAISVAIITNSANFHKREVVGVINKFDVNFCKLDAGDKETFTNINRPLAGAIGFDEIIKGLKKVKSLNIQTAVVDSPKASNISSLKGRFIDIIQDIRPLAVYIHNIDYPTPDKRIRRLKKEEMIQLGQFIADQSGIQVKVLHSLVDLRKKPCKEGAV